MELGEPVAVTMIDTDDWECPFSHDKPGTVKNELTGSPAKLGVRMTSGISTQLWDEDASGNVKTAKIDADKQPVTDAVPQPHRVYVALDHLGNSLTMPFSVAAHHLIPSNASLPNSKLINYVKGGKIIADDIGYGINGRENGIWLPTHHALSMKMPVLPYETQKHSYASISGDGGDTVSSTINLYAQAVMDQTGRQFHDNHTQATNYSNFVTKILDKVASNLTIIKNYNCDKCQKAKSNGGKLPPPHKLVFRLNSISRRLSGYLTGPAITWRPPVYTSAQAEHYANAMRRLRARGRA